jgi:ABC-type transport system involved in multi-copper enzyme maturation permease subunit
MGVSGMLWRAVPVLMLTLRQFAAGKIARVSLALSLLPALFAAIYLIRPAGRAPFTLLVDLFQNLWAPTLVPIVALLLATSAFGNELEDRSLPYLTLKPVSRLRIVLEKWLATVLIAIPALAIGLAVTTLIASRGPVETASRVAASADLWPLYRAMLGATAAGTLLLTAIFLMIGLVIPRALLAGMVYVFAWESLLGRFLPGVQSLSVRHITESVFAGMLGDPTVKVQDAATLGGAWLTVAIAVIIALVLATWRLRTMNQE